MDAVTNAGAVPSVVAISDVDTRPDVGAVSSAQVASGVGAGMGRPGWLVLLQVLALWPVWRWYAAGVGDPSGEPWGVVALGMAGWLLARSRPAAGEASLTLPATLLALYAVSFAWMPPLARAMLGMSALTSSLCIWRLGRPLHLGVWGLTMLSLPIIPSLQFYLGYPLRVAVGALAAGMLRLGGLPVVREGVGLEWAGQTILVDAPCSGVKMLWTGMLLCFTVASMQRLSTIRCAAAALLSLGLIVAGNALRAASLFYLEAGILPLPATAHEGAGVVVFAGTAAAILGIVSRLAERPESRPAVESRVRSARAWPFLTACVLASMAPFLPTTPRVAVAETAFPGFPSSFEGRPLEELPLTDREQRFARDFPGRTARFTDGRRELVIRWVTGETRRLHPAADCFRGLGYEIEPGPAVVDGAGRTWGRFEAARGGERLRVMERIEGADGRGFSDVSAWYWAALTGSSPGPWWAVTVAERE